MEEILHHLLSTKTYEKWIKMEYSTLSTGAGFLPSTVPPMKSGFYWDFTPEELGPKLFFWFTFPETKKSIPKNQGVFEHTVDGRKNMEHLPLFTGFYTSQVVFPRISEPSTGSHPRIFIALVSGDYRSSHAWWVGLLWFIEVSCCLVERWGFWFFFLLGGWDHGTYPSIPWRIPMGMVWFGYIWVKVMVNRGTYTSPMDPMG